MSGTVTKNKKITLIHKLAYAGKRSFGDKRGMAFIFLHDIL